MTFNEFINSSEDMDENSQEYKDFSQCVSAGAYVAFTVVENLLESTPSFNFDDAKSDTEPVKLLAMYREAISDRDDKDDLEKEFIDEMETMCLVTSNMILNKLKTAMRNTDSYKIAVSVIEGDVSNTESDTSDEQ